MFVSFYFQVTLSNAICFFNLVKMLYITVNMNMVMNMCVLMNMFVTMIVLMSTYKGNCKYVIMNVFVRMSSCESEHR